MSIDPFIDRNPSYCFVDLLDADTAQRVRDTMQGLAVRGRPIRVNVSTVKNPSSCNRNPMRIYNAGQIRRDIPTTEADPDTAYVYDRWNRDDAATQWIQPAAEGRRVRIDGFPRMPNQATLNMEMRHLFQDYELEAVSKIISPHHTEQHKPSNLYACYVNFATAHDAQRAASELDQTPTPSGGVYRIRVTTRGTNIARREQLQSTSRLFVGQLPSRLAEYAALQGEMQRVFSDYTIRNITPLKTPSVAKQVSPDGFYYCFVDLADAKQAGHAVEHMDGEELASGAVYKVRLARQLPSGHLPWSVPEGQNSYTEVRSTQAQRNLTGNWRRGM